jgi:hypothetical protein
MFKTRVTGLNKVLSAVSKEISQVGTKLANTILVEAKKITPIKRGRARRGWRVERRGTNTHVVNRVPYIGQLERGRSKQAPRGILKPTLTGLKNRRKIHE